MSYWFRSGIRVSPEPIPDKIAGNSCCKGKYLGQYRRDPEQTHQQMEGAEINQGAKRTHNTEFQESFPLLGIFQYAFNFHGRLDIFLEVRKGHL